MTNFLNHAFLLDGTNWLSEGLPDEAIATDTTIMDEDTGAGINNVDLKSQPIIGILPIRNTVAYPGTIIPLTVGRAESKALLADTGHQRCHDRVADAAEGGGGKPGFDDLYSIGTTASILKTIKMPQGSVNIFVHGMRGFRSSSAWRPSPT